MAHKCGLIQNKKPGEEGWPVPLWGLLWIVLIPVSSPGNKLSFKDRDCPSFHRVSPSSCFTPLLFCLCWEQIFLLWEFIPAATSGSASPQRTRVPRGFGSCPTWFYSAALFSSLFPEGRGCLWPLCMKPGKDPRLKLAGWVSGRVFPSFLLDKLLVFHPPLASTPPVCVWGV